MYSQHRQEREAAPKQPKSQSKTMGKKKEKGKGFEEIVMVITISKEFRGSIIRSNPSKLREGPSGGIF